MFLEILTFTGSFASICIDCSYIEKKFPSHQKILQMDFKTRNFNSDFYGIHFLLAPEQMYGSQANFSFLGLPVV